MLSCILNWLMPMRYFELAGRVLTLRQALRTAGVEVEVEVEVEV